VAASKAIDLSDSEAEIYGRLAADFPHYAAKCLTVASKAGNYERFKLNRAQLYVHEALERQKADTGRVRALVLKGRQQGISTLVAGRYYHQITHDTGRRCFILSHEQRSADTLFDMVDRFQNHCPDLVRPDTGASNAKELYFPGLDSGYEVATAGARETGRSKTIHLFHGSEVAFWQSAAGHFAASVQAVPDLPGTEIILESTANGMGNEFHTRWQQAEAGRSDYIAIFVPWFWQEEYSRDNVPATFELDSEEQAYRDAYQLTLGQMAWRRAKIAELGDPVLFMQEYPASSVEAFQMSGHSSFISPASIMKARLLVLDMPPGDLVIGVDPARNSEDHDGDDFAIAWRRGRKVLKVERRRITDTVDGANWVREVIERDHPTRVFIDTGGLGIGTFDLLRDWGFADQGGAKIVRAVNFGSKPFQPPQIDQSGRELPGPKNRRAEMWQASKDWLADIDGVDIPNDDSLQADALAPGKRYDTQQKMLLTQKKEIRSPDGWDAVALTFAEPVAPARPDISAAPHVPMGGAQSWMG